MKRPRIPLRSHARALAALALLCSLRPAGAEPSPEWARFYDGPAHGFDSGRALVLDAGGNACVVGSSDGIDSGKDIAVAKYDAGGDPIWAARHDGEDSLDDWAYAVAIGPAGDLYVAGETGTSAGGADLVVVCFDSAGLESWSYRYDGPGGAADAAVAIAVDADGGVFVVGRSTGDGSAEDCVTLRLDAGGALQWLHRYDGDAHGTDEGRALALGPDRVLVAGGSTSATGDLDFLTLAYTKAGELDWTALYDGPGGDYDLVYYQGSMAVDPEGNAHVCGYSTGEDGTNDYALIKYDPDGTPLWIRRLAGDGMGNDDFANRLRLDAAGNVYVTGALYSQATEHDIVTAKYDADGELQWIASYDGGAQAWDEGYDLAVGQDGEVLVLGRSPGGDGSTDFALIGYDAEGAQLWDTRYSRYTGAYSWPFDMALDADGAVYAGGWGFGLETGADFTLVKFSEAATGVALPGSAGAGSVPVQVSIAPNPCTRQAHINYRFAGERRRMSAAVYDVSGRKVRSLFEGAPTSAEGRLIWDGRDEAGRTVSAGIYCCLIELADGRRATARLLWLR